MRKVVKLRRGLSQLEETLGPPNVICCSIAFFVINIPINKDFTSSLSICCSMFSAASAFLSISFWQLRMFSFNASIFLLKSFNNQNEIYHRMGRNTESDQVCEVTVKMLLLTTLAP